MCSCTLLFTHRPLFLLFHLKMSFLIDYSSLVLSLPNMKAWFLVSTCSVLCTRDLGFIFKFSHDGHLIVTWRWRPSSWVSGGGWDVNFLPLHFQDVWLPLMFVLIVYSSCKGCSPGWMSQSTYALESLPGLSLLELISAPHLPKDAVLKVLPCESSPCPAAPRDQHDCRF